MASFMDAGNYSVVYGWLSGTPESGGLSKISAVEWKEIRKKSLIIFGFIGNLFVSGMGKTLREMYPGVVFLPLFLLPVIRYRRRSEKL